MIRVSDGSSAGAHAPRTDYNAQEASIEAFKAAHPDKATLILPKANKETRKRAKKIASRANGDKSKLEAAAKALEAALHMEAKSSRELRAKLEAAEKEPEKCLVPIPTPLSASVKKLKGGSMECMNSSGGTVGIMEKRIRDSKLSEREALEIIVNGDPELK